MENHLKKCKPADQRSKARKYYTNKTKVCQWRGEEKSVCNMQNRVRRQTPREEAKRLIDKACTCVLPVVLSAAPTDDGVVAVLGVCLHFYVGGAVHTLHAELVDGRGVVHTHFGLLRVVPARNKTSNEKQNDQIVFYSLFKLPDTDTDSSYRKNFFSHFATCHKPCRRPHYSRCRK